MHIRTDMQDLNSILAFIKILIGSLTYIDRSRWIYITSRILFHFHKSATVACTRCISVHLYKTLIHSSLAHRLVNGTVSSVPYHIRHAIAHTFQHSKKTSCWKLSRLACCTRFAAHVHACILSVVWRSFLRIHHMYKYNVVQLILRCMNRNIGNSTWSRVQISISRFFLLVKINPG